MSNQTHTFKPDLPPPPSSVGALAWIRGNLFSSVGNTLLTLLGLYLVWLIVPPVAHVPWPSRSP